MAGEALQLAVLLTLKDAASGGLDRFGARLRALGKDGEKFHSEFEKIRSDLNRGLAIGAAGITGLKVLKDGVQTAADFQSAMTDLRNTFAQLGADGRVNLNQLGQDMLKAEAIALDLGNRLPGNTQDFVEMMQVLKQNGLEAETIFRGAGKAVGELAVANKSLPKDVAKDFAQFGQLFRLKPEEYERAADVFSRLYTSTGIGSAELIEASKYFQGRTGSAIGISGLKDAEEMTRLFGLMRKHGMEGSMAGTAMDNFFVQYLGEKKKMQEVSQKFGIKLEFFDEKGKFKGVEHLFRELEPLQKLSDKEQAQALQAIFGQRGMAVASMMVKSGLEGWKQHNAEQDKTIGMNEKNAELAKNYNDQMEALSGTLTNLKVAIFEPMIPGATAAVEKANEIVSVIQEFTKTHPDIAKYAVTTLAVGSSAMVAYSGIKTLTTGVRLLRIASAVSRSEGLVGMLSSTNAAAPAAARNIGSFSSQIDTASKKAAGLRKNLLSLNNLFKAIIVVEAVGFTWNQIDNLRNVLNETLKMEQAHDDLGKQSLRAYQGLPESMKDPKAEAKSVLSLLNQGNSEFEKALDPKRRTWADSYRTFFAAIMGETVSAPLYKKKLNSEELELGKRRTEQYARQNPDKGFAEAMRIGYGEVAGAKFLKERAPTLSDPEVMRSFRRDIIPTLNLPKEKERHVDEMLKLAFPESFAASLSGVSNSAEQFAQMLSSLQQPMAGTAELFSGLPQPITDATGAIQNLLPPTNDTASAFDRIVPPAGKLPGAFNNIFSSATSASTALNLLGSKFSSWQPPAPQFGSPAGQTTGSTPGTGVPSIFSPPGFAVGGTVTRSGLAFIHADEDIVPAKAKPYREANARPIVVNAPVTVNVSGGDKQAVLDIRRELYAHAKDIERIVAKAASDGRNRA
jgi:TP901 family phage tail tape measure protein